MDELERSGGLVGAASAAADELMLTPRAENGTGAAMEARGRRQKLLTLGSLVLRCCRGLEGRSIVAAVADRRILPRVENVLLG